MTKWRFIPLIICLFLGIFFWQALSRDPRDLPSAQLGQSLPDFEWRVLGKPNQVLKTKQLHGQMTLLNVWASWCLACREEQVFLLKLARSGIVIYGLNYKDSPEDALKWLIEWGNPYRMVGEDPYGRAAMDLGVYGTPETFLIDEAGKIRYRHAGILDEEVWQKEFLPRMRKNP